MAVELNQFSTDENDIGEIIKITTILHELLVTFVSKTTNHMELLNIILSR